MLARFVDQWVPKSADDLTLFGSASQAGTRRGRRTAGAGRCRRPRRARMRGDGGVAVDTRDDGA